MYQGIKEIRILIHVEGYKAVGNNGGADEVL